MEIGEWLLAHGIEVCGTITGFLFLGFSIRQHFLTWPIGLLNALFYIAVFFYSKIYADMVLQFYYVAISCYGWWCWYKGTEAGNRLNVSKTSRSDWFKLIVIAIVMFLVIAAVLALYTDSQVPIWDGLTTSLSIVATWMMARKKIEHWLIWILVDSLSIGLFIFKELYPTTLLFVTYTILAYYGYVEWRKEFREAQWKESSV